MHKLDYAIDDGPQIIEEQGLQNFLKEFKGILIDRVVEKSGSRDVVLNGSQGVVEIFYCQQNVPRFAHYYNSVETYKKTRFGKFVN